MIREFLLKRASLIDGYLCFHSTLIDYQYSEISFAMLYNFCCTCDRTEVHSPYFCSHPEFGMAAEVVEADFYHA